MGTWSSRPNEQNSRSWLPASGSCDCRTSGGLAIRRSALLYADRRRNNPPVPPQPHATDAMAEGADCRRGHIKSECELQHHGLGGGLQHRHTGRRLEVAAGRDYRCPLCCSMGSTSSGQAKSSRETVAKKQTSADELLNRYNTQLGKAAPHSGSQFLSSPLPAEKFRPRPSCHGRGICAGKRLPAGQVTQ
jgi:hypothetical protein